MFGDFSLTVDLCYSGSRLCSLLGSGRHGYKEPNHLSSLLHSRAASTVNSSLTQHRKFTNFVKESQIPGKFPYTTLVISHYLSHLIETKKTYSVTLQSQSGSMILFPYRSNPADTPLIRNIIEAGKRSPRTTKCKKEPISIDTLAKIVAKYATPDSKLKDLRTVLLCVLVFFGLFRASELTSIKAKDITVNPDHLIIFVPTSKTDQYRNGNQVFIAQTNRHLCPHALLLRYFYLSSIHPIQTNTSSDPSKLPVVVQRQLPFLLNVLVTKGYLAEIIKEAISSVGLDPKQYSTHSLRSGGASFMANSQGNNPNLKLQGRWKSDTSKDMYVKDSLESRLTLTKTFPIIGNT